MCKWHGEATEGTGTNAFWILNHVANAKAVKTGSVDACQPVGHVRNC